jgi:hypothetical protein
MEKDSIFGVIFIIKMKFPPLGNRVKNGQPTDAYTNKTETDR